LLLTVERAPGLVYPGSSRIHVPSVCESYLAEEEVHLLLLPEGLRPETLDPRPPGEDHQSVRDEVDYLYVMVDDHRRPSPRLHEPSQRLRYHESLLDVEECRGLVEGVGVGVLCHRRT